MSKEVARMFCVKEYGENTGTLRNYFRDLNGALQLVEKIIRSSKTKYKTVGPHAWYCRTKKEYVKIEKI